MKNRITDLLGVKYPIVQAPMGWIARAQLASAVSNAGGPRDHRDLLRPPRRGARGGEEDARPSRTSRGASTSPRRSCATPTSSSFVADQGVKFVTTSAGDPNRYCEALKGKGLTVFHVVPSLAAAMKAIEAGRRRAGGGGRRGRRVQEQPRGGDHGAAAAGLLEGEGPGDRRGRDHRRADHGGGLRPGRRGRADGHPDGLGRREPGAPELEGHDRGRQGDGHRLPEPLRPRPGAARAAHREDHAVRAGAARRTSWASSAMRWRSTSAATWRPRSRCPARWPGASTR